MASRAPAAGGRVAAKTTAGVPKNDAAIETLKAEVCLVNTLTLTTHRLIITKMQIAKQYFKILIGSSI